MQGYQPKKSKELKKPPSTGSNVIDLHKRNYDELSAVLIDKVLEIEMLYQKMFDNCKHRSGWCKKGDCKHCQFMK